MTLTPYQKQFLSKLISIPSTGGAEEDGAPYGRNPREALDFFLEEAEKEGFRTGVTGNRAGWVEFGSGDRLIGIICHLDVVPAGEGWKTDPFELAFIETEEGETLTGRGILDDKGPAAASFFAMKELLEEKKIPKDCRVRLILGTDEERSCSCIEYYAKHEEIPVFSITPDAEFPVIYCEKGIIHVSLTGKAVEGFTAKGGTAVNMVPASASCRINGEEIIVTGKSAHASRPDTGINAIQKLAEAAESFGHDLNSIPVLKFVRDFNGTEFSGCSIVDESGELTSNIGLLEADDSKCSLALDFRVPFTYDVREVIRSVEGKAREYGLELSVINAMDALYKDRNSPEVQNLVNIWNKHMDKFTGFKEEHRRQFSEAMSIGGGTYARHIPNTVAFGPSIPWQDDMCHQANESIYTNDFIEWISVIKDFIRTV